jgi:hypothetical protein
MFKYVEQFVYGAHQYFAIGRKKTYFEIFSVEISTVSIARRGIALWFRIRNLFSWTDLRD